MRNKPGTTTTTTPGTNAVAGPSRTTSTTAAKRATPVIVLDDDGEVVVSASSVPIPAFGNGMVPKKKKNRGEFSVEMNDLFKMLEVECDKGQSIFSSRPSSCCPRRES